MLLITRTHLFEHKYTSLSTTFYRTGHIPNFKQMWNWQPWTSKPLESNFNRDTEVKLKSHLQATWEAWGGVGRHHLLRTFFLFKDTQLKRGFKKTSQLEEVKLNLSEQFGCLYEKQSSPFHQYSGLFVSVCPCYPLSTSSVVFTRLSLMQVLPPSPYSPAVLHSTVHEQGRKQESLQRLKQRKRLSREWEIEGETHRQPALQVMTANSMTGVLGLRLKLTFAGGHAAKESGI